MFAGGDLSRLGGGRLHFAAVGETVEDDRANALASDLGGRSAGGRRAAEMSWKSGDMGIHIYNCNIYIIGYEYDLIK
jgi:hypothetical protein